MLDAVTQANTRRGVSIRPQTFPRPFGMIVGFDLSANPFSLCPTYIGLSELPLERRIVELRKPEVRERILNEDPVDPVNPLVSLARSFDYTYVMDEPVNYEPDPANSVSAQARRRGAKPEALAYDLLLENDGRAMLYVALANFAQGSLDFVVDQFYHPDTIIGLGDGGAHYGMICDSSYPTFMLTYWTRERKGTRLPLEKVVQSLTSKPAQLMGLTDRGTLVPGLKADINIVQLERLRLDRPTVCYDLPGGGRCLDQRAHGYLCTLVSGQPIIWGDQPTGALPGKLIRGHSQRKEAA